MTARLPGPQRRSQLLHCARDLFATQGYHQTSMNDIAKVAGVTKPVLYQHFASKRELYRELLDDVGQALQDTIAKATADAAGPREQVEAGFGAYFRYVADNRSAYRLIFGSGTRRDPEFAAVALAVEATIADFVAAMIEVDEIDPHHRQLLAYGVVGLAEGASRHWFTDSDAPVEPELLARQVAELAWAGLRGVRGP